MRLKGIPRISWLRLATPAAAIVLGALALLRPAAASPNTVYIQPATVTADAGDSVNVDLVAEAPAQTLGAWTIEVRFNPKVVSTESRLCDPIDTPSGALGVTTCVVRDKDGDGAKETVTALGAVVYSGSGKGLSGKLVLAAITFKLASSASGCTSLDVTVREFADPDGKTAHPAATNGEICAGNPGASSAPPSHAGSESPGVPNSSGEAGGTATTGNGPTPNGPTSSESTSPSASSSAVTGQRTGTGARSGTPAGGALPGTDDGGGTSPFVIVFLGLLVPALAFSGFVWMRMRRRGSGDSASS